MLKIIIFPFFVINQFVTGHAFTMFVETLQVLILACLTVAVLHMLLVFLSRKNRLFAAAEAFASEVDAQEAYRKKIPKHHRRRRRTMRRKPIITESVTHQEYDVDEDELDNDTLTEIETKKPKHETTQSHDFANMEDELKAWMKRETSNWSKTSELSKDGSRVQSVLPTEADATVVPATAGVENTSADGQSATSIDSLFAEQQKALHAKSPDNTSSGNINNTSTESLQLNVATLPRSNRTARTKRSSAKTPTGTGIPNVQCDGSGYTNVMNADGVRQGLQAFDTAMGSFAAF